ncbi:MAG: hypothetical protein U0271_36845 [Polyangiaceae bacterium]
MDEGTSGMWLVSPPPGARIIDTGAARWWLEGPYVCNQSYVELVTADHLRAGFRAAQELSGGRRVPLVAESGPLSGANREARDLLAGPEAAAVFSAMGVLVRSPVARTIMNLFVRLQSPPFPLRVFTDPTAARDWARQRAVDG